MQIPLLGVSVLHAFGPQIASTATIQDINRFLFTCCFHLIFQYMHGSQNQSMGTFRFEITELLWYQFRYRHCHFQVLEGPKIVSMIVLRGINRPLSSCLFNVRAHTGLKSLTREHEGTLTQTELAIIMQIPLLGVPVLPAFGPKIASTATIHNINLFLFTCCFPLIFQYIYRSQNQSTGTFRFEITVLLCCEFRYRHRHFQVLEWHKPPSWQF